MLDTADAGRLEPLHFLDLNSELVTEGRTQ
jgi:hypothetical protein